MTARALPHKQTPPGRPAVGQADHKLLRWRAAAPSPVGASESLQHSSRARCGSKACEISDPLTPLRSERTNTMTTTPSPAFIAGQRARLNEALNSPPPPTLSQWRAGVLNDDELTTVDRCAALVVMTSVRGGRTRITPGQLALDVGVSAAEAAEALGRLEAAGWIRRTLADVVELGEGR